jgi:hypothetical protein
MKAPTMVFVRRRIGGLGVMVAALVALTAVEVRSQVQSAFTGKVVAVLDVDPREPPPTGTR